MIKNILAEYDYRVFNGMDVPPYLKKQIEGIIESIDNPYRGFFMLIDGMIDKRNYLDKLLDREWMDGLSDKEWMELHSV